MGLQRNSVNNQILGHYLCNIELILLKFGNIARAHGGLKLQSLALRDKKYIFGI
jgi:hypothetical protein